MAQKAAKRATEEAFVAGGDFASLITILTELAQRDPRWRWQLELDDEGRASLLCWMSPAQGRALRRYGDVLINDMTAGTNAYRWPLDTHLVIDSSGKSINVWYALSRSESAVAHESILRFGLEAMERPSLLFFSDFDKGLDAAVKTVFPTTHHGLCLHHMGGNLTKNLAGLLGARFATFTTRFWQAQSSLSEPTFELLWSSLTIDFPAAASYLSDHLYPYRDRWAAAWMRTRFTAGVRTTARVEREHGVNKILLNPKLSGTEVVLRLNARSEEQEELDLQRRADVSSLSASLRRLTWR